MPKYQPFTPRGVGTLLVLLSLNGLLSACNKEPQADGPAPAAQQSAAAEPVEAAPASGASAPDPAKVKAFLSGMVPHHEMAVEMARIAQEQARTPEIKSMAQDIIKSQGAEIEQMKAIHLRLYGGELKPDMMAHDALGMSMDEAGMHMDVASLKTADPFDRAFIDMMVPHHQGAIRMAHVLLANTQDAELAKLGQDIITAQSGEIESMNALRLKLYGAVSPAGGIPAEQANH